MLKRCLQENTVRATSVSRGTSMDKPTTEGAKVGNVDVEALSRNLARLIEEGGKALGAYLKPREEGKIKGRYRRRHHRCRQIGRPRSGILDIGPTPRT